MNNDSNDSTSAMHSDKSRSVLTLIKDALSNSIVSPSWISSILMSNENNKSSEFVLREIKTRLVCLIVALYQIPQSEKRYIMTLKSLLARAEELEQNSDVYLNESHSGNAYHFDFSTPCTANKNCFLNGGVSAKNHFITADKGENSLSRTKVPRTTNALSRRWSCHVSFPTEQMKFASKTDNNVIKTRMTETAARLSHEFKRVEVADIDTLESQQETEYRFRKPPSLRMKRKASKDISFVEEESFISSGSFIQTASPIRHGFDYDGRHGRSLPRMFCEDTYRDERIREIVKEEISKMHINNKQLRLEEKEKVQQQQQQTVSKNWVCNTCYHRNEGVLDECEFCKKAEKTCTRSDDLSSDIQRKDETQNHCSNNGIRFIESSPSEIHIVQRGEKISNASPILISQYTDAKATTTMENKVNAFTTFCLEDKVPITVSSQTENRTDMQNDNLTTTHLRSGLNYESKVALDASQAIKISAEESFKLQTTAQNICPLRTSTASSYGKGANVDSTICQFALNIPNTHSDTVQVVSSTQPEDLFDKHESNNGNTFNVTNTAKNNLLSNDCIQDHASKTFTKPSVSLFNINPTSSSTCSMENMSCDSDSSFKSKKPFSFSSPQTSFQSDLISLSSGNSAPSESDQTSFPSKTTQAKSGPLNNTFTNFVSSTLKTEAKQITFDKSPLNVETPGSNLIVHSCTSWYNNTAAVPRSCGFNFASQSPITFEESSSTPIFKSKSAFSAGASNFLNFTSSQTTTSIRESEHPNATFLGSTSPFQFGQNKTTESMTNLNVFGQDRNVTCSSTSRDFNFTSSTFSSKPFVFGQQSNNTSLTSQFSTQIPSAFNFTGNCAPKFSFVDQLSQSSQSTPFIFGEHHNVNTVVDNVNDMSNPFSVKPESIAGRKFKTGRRRIKH